MKQVFCCCLSQLTYWIINEAVTLVINEDESGSSRVRIKFPDSNNMTELIHITPVLNEEIVDSTTLKTMTCVVRRKFMHWTLLNIATLS